MQPEQAAFEKAIEENPREAINHLVYADWLDENGQPEEAAFRRAMGEWHQDPEWHSYHDLTASSTPGTYPVRVDRGRLPAGVRADSLPSSIHLPTVDDSNALFSFASGRYGTTDYKTLEKFFRGEFMRGLDMRRAQQMQRRSVAKRCIRRDH